jgi:hypothetical protein
MQHRSCDIAGGNGDLNDQAWPKLPQKPPIDSLRRECSYR